MDEWEIFVTDEVRDWISSLDAGSHRLVVQAIDILADRGPGLGRPLVDRVEYSPVHNLKELRPGSSGHSELRVLFVFDPWRSAILLVAGDKSGDWKHWYSEAIPRAEHLLEIYLKERAEEEGGG
ncbi:MAG: type II toxin-antitoxin system RelE/ParE family toxin [Actinomycetota bacterium]|nr:type II toxin-antitoxin system RelE/ParE family toxin [Actinomycetota bacterium]